VGLLFRASAPFACSVPEGLLCNQAVSLGFLSRYFSHRHLTEPFEANSSFRMPQCLTDAAAILEMGLEKKSD
jgi:hypothetical protein